MVSEIIPEIDLNDFWRRNLKYSSFLQHTALLSKGLYYFCWQGNFEYLPIIILESEERDENAVGPTFSRPLRSCTRASASFSRAFSLLPILSPATARIGNRIRRCRRRFLRISLALGMSITYIDTSPLGLRAEGAFWS